MIVSCTEVSFLTSAVSLACSRLRDSGERNFRNRIFFPRPLHINFFPHNLRAWNRLLLALNVADTGAEKVFTCHDAEKLKATLAKHRC